MSDNNWLSADECNRRSPDLDYGSTIDNLEAIYAVSTALKCWKSESVPTAQIDPGQLIDDPAAVESHLKADEIGRSIRAGVSIPPVIIVHHPEADTYPYNLIEGRHRYNAAYREEVGEVKAWVAHVGCCGGPEADL